MLPPHPYSDAVLLTTRRRRLAQVLHKTSNQTDISDWPTKQALDNTNVAVMRTLAGNSG